MIDVVLLAVVLAASGAAGLAVLRVASALPRRPDEHLLAGAATGLGLASMLALGLAAAQALGPLPFAIAAIAALAVGGRDLVGALRAVRAPRGWLARGLVLVCVASLLAQAPTWFAPPVGGDQTKYHLAYPRLWANAGGLVPTPWCFWGNQQWLQNFLFVLAYAVRGEDLARLLNAASGVMAALSVATLARRHLDRRLGVAVGVLFFTMPMTWSQMTRSGADMSVVVYAGLAVAALLDWALGARPGDLRRAAIMAGLAGGSKVMGLLVPALVGIGVLVVLARRRPAIGQALGSAVAYGAIALVALSPWYVRNAVEVGDPMHPFGHAAFHGRHWSPEAATYLDTYYAQYRAREAGDRGGKPYVGLDVAWFPWDLTMHPESFENGKRQGQDVSPIVLTFLPSLLLVRRRRRAAFAIAAIGVAYAAVIAVGAWAHPRYVLPGVALAMTASVAGAQALAGRRWLPWIVAITVAGNVALTSRLLRPMWPDQVRVALGRLAPDAFLARYSERWLFWHEANRAVPADGRVALLEKITHPYYIDRPFVMLSYLEQGQVDYRATATPDAVLGEMARLGATHVAVDVKGLDAAADPFERQVTTLWRGVVAQLGAPVLTAGGYALYTLPSAEAAVAKAGGPPRFVKDALRVLGGQVAMTAIGVVTGIITARWLGPHDRGLFQLLTLLPTTLSNFVKLGIPQASVYFMRRKGASASAVASNSVWMAFVMGTALAVVCWFWRDWLLENVMKEAPSELILPTLVLIPFALLQFYLLGIAQAQERFREYNLRQIVPNLLSLVGMFVVLVVFQLGLVGAVLTQAAIVVFMALWLTVRVHREAPLTPRVDGELLRGMLGFGGKSYVQTLAATLHLRIDQYLIAYLLNPGEVAYYAIGVNLASLLLKISDATGTVLFPRLAASDREAADLATMRVCRSTLFLTTLGVVGLAIVGPIAIPLLYGEPFRHAIGPLLILLPGVLLMAVYQILTRNFTSRAKQEINIVAALTALVLNVGLNWVLIPRYGIEGAAVAHALSYGTAAIILLVAFVRESGHSLREIVLVGRTDLNDLVSAARRMGGLTR